MSKFVKKPIVIDAFQMTAERMWDNSEWPEWLHLAWNGNGEPGSMTRAMGDGMVIATLEGNHRCEVNDWIIRGIKGELYPCKPDIFEATYEPVRAAVAAG